MSSKLTASEARQNFSDILNRAKFGGERVLVHRGKKPVAAIMPVEDYEFLEELEDRRGAALTYGQSVEESSGPR